MFVIGVGTAFPDQVLSEEDLAALGVEMTGGDRILASRVGVVSRRVSLPIDYIRATGNADCLQGWKVATQSPTGLAVQAVRSALDNAGIAIDSVGLLLADTATPYQTCPSEAQRVAGAFGVKIPAYDVVAGIGAFPHFLSMLSAWRDDRLPEYAVCLSTNTPSQHVRYSDGAAALVFGDAAAAFILSKRHPSPVRVRSIRMSHEERHPPAVVVEGGISVRREAMHSRDTLAAFIRAEIDELTRVHADVMREAMIIPPQMYGGEALEIVSACGVSSDRIVMSCRNGGFSLGSSYGVALASRWEEIRRGVPAVMLHCGDGMRGSVIMGK